MKMAGRPSSADTCCISVPLSVGGKNIDDLTAKEGAARTVAQRYEVMKISVSCDRNSSVRYPRLTDPNARQLLAKAQKLFALHDIRRPVVLRSQRTGPQLLAATAQAALSG